MFKIVVLISLVNYTYILMLALRLAFVLLLLLLQSRQAKRGRPRSHPVLPAPPWVPLPFSVRSGGGRAGEPRIWASGM